VWQKTRVFRGFSPGGTIFYGSPTKGIKLGFPTKAVIKKGGNQKNHCMQNFSLAPDTKIAYFI
jgi:hypothetical protein